MLKRLCETFAFPSHLILMAILFLGFQSSAFGQVTWITAGNGNWQDGVNWSTASVPGAGDDVEIDQGGGFLITIGAPISSINSLISAENILISQDVNLVMAAGGTTNGTLTLGIRSDLINNSGTFTANGITVLDGGNVFANGGSTMDLSIVSSYLTNTGFNDNRTLEANDASSLDLSGLTTLTGGGFIQVLNVNANSGSSVDLSNLNNYVGGSTRFNSDGIGSSIDISSMTTFNVNDGSQGRMIVRNGGLIDASSLTTIDSNGANGVLLQIDGATSTLINSALTSVANTRVQLTNGGTHDFSGITSFNGSDAFADSGVTLDLSGVTSYDTNNGGNNDRNFSSEGAGTVVDLSNVSTMIGGTFIRELNVNTSNGGEMDLSGLTDVNGGRISFDADGANSLIDLSSLENFAGSVGQSTMTAINGGEIRLDTNIASNLNFNQVDINLQATGTIDTSRITNYTNGTFTSNGVNRVLELVDGTNSSFIANDTAILDVSSLTGTLQNTGPNFWDMNLEANGSGSTLDISNVTELSYNSSGVSPNINLRATDGGFVDASGVQSLLAAGGIINSNRAINVTADGVGSIVDLSSVTTYSDTGSFTDSLIMATNDGQVMLGGTGTTTLTNVTIMLESNGSLVGDTLDLISLTTNNSGAPDDFSTISGNGTIFADVINSSGIISPGLSAGELTIDGDFTQLNGGTMEMEIVDLANFDVLNVTGDANLDGMFALTLDGAFDLLANMDFLMMSIDGVASGQFDGLTQGSIITSDNGFDLRIDYFGGDGNDVLLTTNNVVPEPGTLGLIMLGVIGLCARRRERLV